MTVTPEKARVIDAVFDSGHDNCNRPIVHLQMCATCAEFLTDLLGKARAQVETKAEALGEDASDLTYYLGAFEADLITQILGQTGEDVDEALSALLS